MLTSRPSLTSLPGAARPARRIGRPQGMTGWGPPAGLWLVSLCLGWFCLCSSGLCAGSAAGLKASMSDKSAPNKAGPGLSMPSGAAMGKTMPGKASLEAMLPGALNPGLPGLPALPPMPNLGARAATLLPQPGQLAQVMKLGSQLAMVDLQTRVLRAGGSREALQNVLASVARGQVPTYDERLGISRAEFGKYLAFQPVLVAAGKTVRMALARDLGRLIFGDSGGAASLLRGLSFDLKTGDLHVPEGFTFKAQTVLANNAPDRSVDIRGGLQWNMRGYSTDTQNGLNGQLSLFQLGSGQTLLVYKRTSMIHGAVNEGEVMLSYDR